MGWSEWRDRVAQAIASGDVTTDTADSDDGGSGSSSASTTVVSELAGTRDSHHNDPTSPGECSLREIKKQIIIFDQKIDRISNKLGEHEQAYRRELAQGAEADDATQQVHVVKAVVQRNRYQLAHLRRLQLLKNRMLWETAKAQRELSEDFSKHGFEAPISASGNIEFDIEEFQQKIDEVNAELRYQLEEIETAVQSSGRGVDSVVDSNTPEYRLMNEIATGERNPESVTIDVEGAADAGTASQDIPGGTGGMNDFQEEVGMFESLEKLHSRVDQQTPVTDDH
ncbi:hypothetical protein [Halorubrum lipolyticum]|uniref:Uncharacterized protein n=1 Tax=Halorubrum lipolyticum DSM 21995 TaxID=1227482 RepID=M0NQX3_9EURY|nr:hypothetical protein [Halorubrum lipolyticum]EMA59609.1 hypothetical protein C469_09806 [Halorubrum lipolyticum DSM 21995]